ncbi:LysM peptidoglycan-binding domain-containing protein [Thalassobacillus hwangdonensis]|uniref:LysM peptidoglycan-binding domain-containing protein n=1 Tax=Thalassobacillus hwangdonensis TaxID=546108 RepID=A0ABW3KXB3_9BACI
MSTNHNELKEDNDSMKVDKQEKNHYESPEIDVLDLPPRKKVHQANKTKMKWKLSLPIIRFLLVIFLLVIIGILTYPYWKDSLEDIPVFSQETEGGVVGERLVLKSEVTGLPEPPEGYVYYKVREGETVNTIVKEHFGTNDTVEQLERINQSDLKDLSEGDVIIVPASPKPVSTPE